MTCWVQIQVSLIHPANLARKPQQGGKNIFMSCLYLSGRGGAQLKRYRPVCPPKPANLSQHTKVPGGRVSLPNLTPASSASSLSSFASSTSGSSTYSRRSLQRHAVIPDTVKLPSGVLLESASSTQTPPGNWALNYSRRKDLPGRRKDSTQSLYIESPECDILLHFSSCPPSSSSSSTSIIAPAAEDQNCDPEASKGQRRFSDPDMPYMDKDMWQERCFIFSPQLEPIL